MENDRVNMDKSLPSRLKDLFSKKIRIIFMVSIIIIFLWPIPVLEVHSIPDKSLIFHSALPKTRGFELQYTHSWDKTPIWDIFKVDIWGNLILEKERYLWMGAGLDYYPGDHIEFNEDGVTVTHNRKIGELQLAVGTIANHRFIIGSNEIALTELVPPGAKVLIKTSIMPWSIFHMKGSERIEKR